MIETIQLGKLKTSVYVSGTEAFLSPLVHFQLARLILFQFLKLLFNTFCSSSSKIVTISYFVCICR